MTRYKKELSKRGYKLPNDYPFLPYQTMYTTIEGSYALVVQENNKWYIKYVVDTVSISLIYYFDNNFNCIKQDFI